MDSKSMPNSSTKICTTGLDVNLSLEKYDSSHSVLVKSHLHSGSGTPDAGYNASTGVFTLYTAGGLDNRCNEAGTYEHWTYKTVKGAHLSFVLPTSNYFVGYWTHMISGTDCSWWAESGSTQSTGASEDLDYMVPYANLTLPQVYYKATPSKYANTYNMNKLSVTCGYSTAANHGWSNEFAVYFN